MTSVIRDLAHEYRQRAEEVRVKAEAATDDFSRKSLLQIAYLGADGTIRGADQPASAPLEEAERH